MLVFLRQRGKVVTEKLQAAILNRLIKFLSILVDWVIGGIQQDKTSFKRLTLFVAAFDKGVQALTCVEFLHNFSRLDIILRETYLDVLDIVYDRLNIFLEKRVPLCITFFLTSRTI